MYYTNMRSSLLLLFLCNTDVHRFLRIEDVIGGSGTRTSREDTRQNSGFGHLQTSRENSETRTRALVTFQTSRDISEIWARAGHLRTSRDIPEIWT